MPIYISLRLVKCCWKKHNVTSYDSLKIRRGQVYSHFSWFFIRNSIVQSISLVDVWIFKSSRKWRYKVSFVHACNLISLKINERGLSTLSRARRCSPDWVKSVINLLTVLDLPTLRRSPQYEVPTKPHTTWCGSPIRYDGLIAIILKICLKYCLSAQESGLLCLWEVSFACFVIYSVTCVNGSFTVEGEGGSESQDGSEEVPTLLGTHNTIWHAQLPEE